MAMATEEKKYLNLETLALIYGIFNIILSTVSILVGIEYLARYNILCLNTASESFLIVTAISPGPGLLFLPFSILLVYGVCEKQPSLVHTYFIFGITFLILAVPMCIYFLIEVHVEYGAVCLIGYLIYSLPLIVVSKTIKKMQANTDIAFQQILVKLVFTEEDTDFPATKKLQSDTDIAFQQILVKPMYTLEDNDLPSKY